MRPSNTCSVLIRSNRTQRVFCRMSSLLNLPKATYQTIVALVLGMMLISTCPAYAQGTAKKGSSEDKSLRTKDGHEIKVTYFKSTAGPDTPVVVLLHGKGGNRQVWKAYAEILQKNDFAAITVDLRQHGESVAGGGSSSGSKKTSSPNLKPADYQAMVAFDLEAVKKFIFEEHQKKQLNMNKLGIIGSDMSSAVAMSYLVADWSKEPHNDAPVESQKTPRGQDVQALVLLSPEATVAGLFPTKAAQFIREIRRPVMLAVGNKVPKDVSDANKMHEQLDPKKDEKDRKDEPIIFLEKYDVKLSGTDMLGKTPQLKLEQHIGTFLTNHLKNYKSEWRDRESKENK